VTFKLVLLKQQGSKCVGAVLMGLVLLFEVLATLGKMAKLSEPVRGCEVLAAFSRKNALVISHCAAVLT
jgi:hypothetical protein